MVTVVSSEQVKEITAYLAEYYVEGIAITCIVVVAIYLIFSIRLVFTSKDVGMKILSLAFVPGLNIILWVIKCFRSIIKSRMVKRDYNKEESESDV
jgi:hypothetical protein